MTLTEANLKLEEVIQTVETQLLDELADALRSTAKDEQRVAQLVASLMKRMKIYEIRRRLVERGVYPYSTSWLYRLGKIWAWWVEEAAYPPSVVFSLPRTKLYIAMVLGVKDLDSVRLYKDLTDKEFRSRLLADMGLEIPPPKAVSVWLTAQAWESLRQLTERLSALTGHRLTPHSTAEFLVEVGYYMSDKALLDAWNVVHGEAQG